MNPPLSTLEQIEFAILTLPTQEFQRLREWLLELDQQHWDQQIEQDVNDGKLDALAAEAIAEFEGGVYPKTKRVFVGVFGDAPQHLA